MPSKPGQIAHVGGVLKMSWLQGKRFGFRNSSDLAGLKEFNDIKSERLGKDP